MVLRPRRLSVRLFVCEIATAAFLFHIAEIKLYQIILWRIHFTLFPSWKSQAGLPAAVAYQGVDGVTRRYVTRVHVRGSPE
jgi:hypothetical protein